MSKEFRGESKNQESITAKQHFISMAEFHDEMTNLMGRILTIIDATTSSETQNKALKDLVKDNFYERLNIVKNNRGYYWDGKELYLTNFEGEKTQRLNKFGELEVIGLN